MFHLCIYMYDFWREMNVLLNVVNANLRLLTTISIKLFLFPHLQKFVIINYFMIISFQNNRILFKRIGNSFVNNHVPLILFSE